LSEAQLLPSIQTEMAVLGPIVANGFLFVFVSSGRVDDCREWQSASHNKAPPL